MEAFQKRVIEERDELKEKAACLFSFINSPLYQELEFGECKRLDRQHMIMSLYIDVLDERINKFKVAQS